jgi:hypothetical protein
MNNSGDARRLARLIGWGMVAALGLLQVWAYRNTMNSDGISYLEIGRAGICGWHGFVNGYWSPLYPFLLSLMLRWFQPSPFWEFPATHFLNLAIYLAGYACFELLVREFLASREISQASDGKKYLFSGAELNFSATVFYVWASRYWAGTALVTPDLLVAAIFCVGTAMLVCIRRGKGNWLTFALLGLILGFGYLAKAPMFLLGFVFVFAAYRLVRSVPEGLMRAGVALVFFLIIAAPYVTALSRSKHRFTFSDSGVINYAEYINGVPLFVSWHGEDARNGTPAHLARRLSADPAVYEFATPVPGSYPPWYDSSYWYEGVRARFSLKGQMLAIFRGINEYLKMVSRSGALWCVLVALIWLTRRGGGLDRADRVWWPVLLPGVAMLAMYSLVHAETRFVTGVGLIFIAWILSRVQIAAAAAPEKVRWAKIAVFLAPAIAVAWSVTSDLKRLAHPEPFVAWESAQALHAAGIPSGASVGYIGAGLVTQWPHLAGVRIIAEMPDPGWSRLIALDPATRQSVLQKFADAGAIAIVTGHAEVTRSDSGWRPLGNSGNFVLKLGRPESSGAPGASKNYP